MSQETWKVEGTQSGAVQINIGGKAVTITAVDAGRMAVALLDCAKAGKDPNSTPAEGKPVDWLHVRPTTITLGSSPDPGCEALVLGFGPAFLGVSLKKQHLKQIGEGMIALSAGGQAQ